MGNWDKAVECANELDRQIINALTDGRNFRVEAGAGAGKTHSLMKVINWLERERRKEFVRYGQHVACITYTNAAVDVIKGRLSTEDFIQPCTIHEFAWRLMEHFQSTLIKAADELNLLPKLEDGSVASVDNVRAVKYELGVKYLQDGVLFLHHDDVIKLFVKLLDNAKFQSVLARRYPIILIDEYQDSFKSIMDKFLQYFIETKRPPQFGLFGDAWQTIYSSMGACGEVLSDKITVINKKANFRSQEKIVQILNHIRPEFPQITALDDNDGKTFVILSEDYSGERQKGYYKGELPEKELFHRIDSVREKLNRMGWLSEKKTLMLTHKMLAKEQHYEHLLELLGDHLKDADDTHYLFFRDRVEPVYAALENNDPKQLFEALGVARMPIESKAQKKEWKEFYERLSAARNGKIVDVIKTVKESNLVGLSEKIEFWLEAYKNGNEDNLFYKRPIRDFYETAYKEVLNAIEFQRPEAEFSTDHGVKGEEYDSVLLIVGRGWNNYKFDETLYLNPANLEEKELDAYIRNRNLFYVCCSRAVRNFAMLITVPVDARFRTYLNNIFGEENIINYTDFIGLP